VIGPQLPPSAAKRVGHDSEIQNGPTSSTTSHVKNLPLERVPVAASEEEEGDDEDDIGPYPPDDPRSQRIPKPSFELTSKTSAKPKREEWMLIPPKNKTISEVIGQVGLTSRKFLGRTPDEVKPPDDEEQEQDFLETAREEFEAKCAKERDERMDEMLKSANSLKEKESLLYSHRKRRKVEEKGPTERRPFDRDVDLSVSGLSEEDKEKFIKKTAELTSRFRGGKQKFL